jgi:lipopolysaccharide biosynthesis glycosyltransferase
MTLRKCYFAINENGLAAYEELIKVMVISCFDNTNLEMTCLYDGADKPLIEWLRNKRVNVICHRSSLASEIVGLGGTVDWSAETAAGAYLRLDIATIEQTDEFVLYVDADVMFLKGLESLNSNPGYFACAPEHNPTDWTYFNSGVMAINVPAMRSLDAEFKKFAIRGMRDFWKAGRGTYDQGALNAFFCGQWDRLPLEWNWKPYWGINDDTRILHFHGPKPQFIRDLMTDASNVPDVYKVLYNFNHLGCKHYLDIFDRYRRQI